MATKQEVRLQAIAAYESAHLVAHDLLTKIRESLVDAMPHPDFDAINWGHVGTVTAIAAKLAEVVDMIEGCK